jgi:two-component system response regulator PilR (NtrC family)
MNKGTSSDMAKVMIVEDNIQLGRLYEKTLSDSGHQVSIVRTIRGALAHLEAAAPDVILLDMAMPDGSGAAVIDYVRGAAHLNKTRIIVATGNTQHNPDNNQGDHFLYKPISTITLRDVVNRLAREPRIST